VSRTAESSSVGIPRITELPVDRDQDPLPRTGGCQADHVVEDEMTFVERVVRLPNGRGPQPLLLEDLPISVGCG